MSYGKPKLRKHLLRTRPSFRRLFRASLLALFLLAIIQVQPSNSLLQRIHSSGELVVTGVSGPTTFYQSTNGTRGLQYELARLFAEDLGVKLVLKDAQSSGAVLDNLKRNQTNIAITGLASNDSRLNRLRTSLPYLTVDEQLVQLGNRPVPQHFDDLENARIGALAGSSEAARLNELVRWRPDLSIIEFADADPMELLQRLEKGELDYVALNSSEFDARRQLFPQMVVSLNLQENSELAWAFVKTTDQSLYHAAQDFFARIQADGTLDHLIAFYGQGDTFNSYAIRSFQRDMAVRLPRYQRLFETNAEKQGMDWRLLAAISYQESHWQPEAVSYTGVQGIMQLTQDTADYFKADRNNVSDSIRAGASYFRMIRNDLPPSVREPDRTWMALASYNMGPAHINRARINAQKAGDDADKWHVVAQHLQRMGKEARAKGRTLAVGQALSYVQQVRRYYDSLLMASATNNDHRVASLSDNRHQAQ